MYDIICCQPLNEFCTPSIYLVENVIRPFVVGQKGWLFADTPYGTEVSSIIYSLIETAKANHLRLDEYLLHLLSILPKRAEQGP